MHTIGGMTKLGDHVLPSTSTPKLLVAAVDVDELAKLTHMLGKNDGTESI